MDGAGGNKGGSRVTAVEGDGSTAGGFVSPNALSVACNMISSSNFKLLVVASEDFRAV